MDLKKVLLFLVLLSTYSMGKEKLEQEKSKVTSQKKLSAFQKASSVRKKLYRQKN